jgi:uroporphyrinogen decarboxylase
MNSLERVRLCFAHREADRIPIDFGGWLSGIKPSAHRKLAGYLGIGPDQWSGYSPGEDLLVRFGIDFRRVTPDKPAGARSRQNPDGSTTDEWGITRVLENEDDQIVRFPLAEADLAGLERFAWPDASGRGRYDRVAAAARAVRARGFAVSAQPDINGVFELACWLCGFDRILADMALDPGFVLALFERITRHQERFAANYYSVVRDDIDMVQLGDDFGTQNGPFFSPEMYREMVLPFQRRYHQAIRAHTRAKIFHHSCGSVYRLLEAMIEAGVEILNPVQGNAAEMDLGVLKKEFGEQLVFHGGINVQTVLPRGTPQQVRDEVKRVIEILAPGGGYVLAPSHNIQGDTPPENVVAMFEAALEFGAYR